MPSLLRHRSSSSTIWCTPGTSTYISITASKRPLPLAAVLTTFSAAKTWTSIHIEEAGDGPLQDGLFNFLGVGGIHLTVWDANNHQVTYGVMGGVVLALEGVMARDGYGETNFRVYDGKNWVGQGMVAVS